MKTNVHGKKVFKLLLTGGPCAGKTNTQKILAGRFREKGWIVYCVPEAVTTLRIGGVERDQLSEEQLFQWQKGVVGTIIQLESVYDNIAINEARNRTMIICDRGVLDSKTYTNDDDWRQIQLENDLSNTKAMARYDCVIHMVTAAYKAEKYYNTETNPARLEKDITKAREKDDQTRNVWKNHHNFHIIDNEACQSFEDKVRNLIELLDEILLKRE